ncbi:MAG: peroxidase [Planctomyces sp.]|nr:peroxidase [Planctomyces sp.]MBA4038766.1 peroxidase [Planctomyces sp.]MBA4120153.1 peroxidase [Isosphaera sp.]
MATGRIGAVDPKTATGKVKELFEGPLKGMENLNIFRGIAQSPAALAGLAGLSGALGAGTFSAAEREVIQLTVGQANNCGYCLAAHTQISKGAGLSEDTIKQARRAQITTNPKLAALSRFAAVIQERRGNVSDQDIATFKAAGYTDGQVVEAVANFALATFTNYFNHVNQTPVDFPAAPAL